MEKPTAPQPEEKSGIAEIPDFCRYAERDSVALCLANSKIVLISQPYGCALRTMDSPTG